MRSATPVGTSCVRDTDSAHPRQTCVSVPKRHQDITDQSGTGAFAPGCPDQMSLRYPYLRAAMAAMPSIITAPPL